MTLYWIGFAIATVAAAETQTTLIHDVFSDPSKTHFDWTSIRAAEMGSGDQDLQHSHVKVENGFLTITADYNNDSSLFSATYGKTYTSGQIVYPKYFRYGEVTFNISIPHGKGLMSWAQLSGRRNCNGDRCAHIVLFNFDPHLRNVFRVGAKANTNASATDLVVHLPTEFDSGFHVIRLVWTRQRVEWWVNGVLRRALDDEYVPHEEMRLYFALEVAHMLEDRSQVEDTSIFPAKLRLAEVKIVAYDYTDPDTAALIAGLTTALVLVAVVITLGAVYLRLRRGYLFKPTASGAQLAASLSTLDVR